MTDAFVVLGAGILALVCILIRVLRRKRIETLWQRIELAICVVIGLALVIVGIYTLVTGKTIAHR